MASSPLQCILLAATWVADDAKVILQSHGLSPIGRRPYHPGFSAADLVHSLRTARHKRLWQSPLRASAAAARPFQWSALALSKGARAQFCLVLAISNHRPSICSTNSVFGLSCPLGRHNIEFSCPAASIQHCTELPGCNHRSRRPHRGQLQRFVRLKSLSTKIHARGDIYHHIRFHQLRERVHPVCHIVVVVEYSDFHSTQVEDIRVYGWVLTLLMYFV